MMRDVIVCIPGITGSVLRKDGKDVWNISGGAVLSALSTFGGSIRDLKLERDPPEVDDLGDGITAPEVIRDVHLIPGFWKVDGYTKMMRYIEETFDVRRGRNIFEFPYDWRRDNRVAARRLARQAREWLEAWRTASGARDAKLVLVGHSMGGLIARHFLECLEGWRDTRTLVTFGTPYRGSLNALDTLVNGKKIKFFDLTEVARSFTAIHQLLPTYPSYDGGDGNLVRVDETDIPHLGRVVGIKQPTQQSALRDGDRIKLRRRIGSEDPGGDGTVPRPSATPLELEDDKGAAFSAERHASLQNDDHVLLQLTGVLTGNAIDWQRYRGVVPMVDLSLDVDDLYSPSEPLVVQAQPDNDSVEELVAVAVDVESGEERARKPLAPNDQGWHAAELGQLPEGVYRITVFGGEAVEPVSDLVTVLAE